MKKLLTFSVVLTTILWTMGVAALVPAVSAATLSAGTLIKASGAAVYYYAADGKRYTFPTESTYKTWYSDFSGVMSIKDDELAAIDLAGNVVVRAGTKLVKITTVPKVFAVSPKGKLSWVKTEAAAKALYGNDWAKRIIDVPDGFWTNYTDSAIQLDGTVYPEGTLVSKDSVNYYVTADGKWSKVTATGFTANSFKTADAVATTLALGTLGADIAVAAYTDVSQGGGAGTGTTTTTVGALTVALATDSPLVGNIPTNATAAAANVPFTYVNFTAGSEAVKITGLKVVRTGLSQNAAIASVKIFDGDTQVGNGQSLNSSNQAVFNNIAIDVAANTTKKIILAATMTASATYNSNIISLGVAAASDVTTTASVAGTFPITGNTQTINTGVTIGTAVLYNGSLGTRNTTDLTVDTDAKDVRFTQVKVTAGSAEGITIKSVTALKNGTAATADLTNIRLYDDTNGKTLSTVTALNASGRAVFGGLNISVDKGKSVELSVLADMNKSGAGRTVAFDLHDGTDYLISIVGNTYGYGITPTRNNFCAAAGTCTTQSINQGYLIANLSATTPATGNISIGATEVPLLRYDLIAAGESINVTSTVLTISTGTAERSQVTQVTIYDETNGKIVAGPKDCTTASAGTETLTFTDAYTISGTTKFLVKANMASDMSASDTVYAALSASGITAKGADSGKTTYTTSSGSTVPPAAVVTGKTQTVKGPTLKVVNATTPVASTFIVNSQDLDLAYFDLDPTAGGEDIKLTSLVVVQTLSSGTDYDNFSNLELWGDQDNTDATDTIARLETSTATSTGANSNTFTFKTPLRLSKSKVARLTLRADVTTTDAVTHAFAISADPTAVGWSTGGTADQTTITSPVGSGQAHSLAAAGTLKVVASSDRASAAQFVAGSTGNSLMSYKFQATNEQVDVTTFYIATTGTTANANIASVKLYVDGVQVGSTNGYTLDDGHDAYISLDSGSFVVAKSPSYTTLNIKVDFANKDNLTDAATLEIGLGDTTGVDGEWGVDGAEAAGDYRMNVTGKSSGAAVATIDDVSGNVDSLGTGAGNVIASYVHYLYDGVLEVSLNSASPTGTASAGTNKEVLRFDLKAIGDDITVNALEFCLTGSGDNASDLPTGTLALKSSDLGTTYGDITMTLTGDYDAYWSVAGLAGAGDYYFTADNAAAESRCISFGDGTSKAVANAAGSAMEGFTNDVGITVAAGTTKTLRLFMDTTGIGTNKTMQVNIMPNPYSTCGAGNDASCAVTTSGVEWENSGGTDVDALLTKNLPINGGSLVY